MELASLLLAAVACVVVFVPALAAPGDGLRHGRRVADEAFPPGDRAELGRALASRDEATFAGALDPTVAAALARSGRTSEAMLPPGSTVTVATRFVELAGVGSVDASVTGPESEQVQLHLVRRSGHWRVFATEPVDASSTTVTTAASSDLAPVTSTATTATTTTGTTAPTTSTTSTSTATAGPEATCDDPGAAVPVLLVHGFADSPEIFRTGAPSLEQVLAAVPGTFLAAPFDYRDASRQWVDDAAIGPALATRVDCLARASAREGGPGKVVVVAHSMGGLATRFAAAQTVHGRPVAGDLALVVTIATPETGSYLASEATAIVRGRSAAGRSVLGALARAACPRTPAGAQTSDPLCDLVSDAGSPAVRAMVPGSLELARLAPFPSTLPVLALAGDVRLTVDVFDATHVPLEAGGDLVVDATSALAVPTAGTGAGQVTVGCDAPVYEPVGDLHALGGLPTIEQAARAALYAAPPQCWHLGLPSLPAVQAAAVSGIRTVVGSAP